MFRVTGCIGQMGEAILMPGENTDINLLTHRIIRQGDLITIRKDGTVLLNSKIQDELQMELM